MSRRDPHLDIFNEGRRHAIAAVRQSMAQGVWTPRRRANLLKVAVRLSLIHRCQAHERTYYAGLISVLKSRLSAQFSRVPSPWPECETGWDFEGDEDNFGAVW
jgi:hypothetical protein